MGCSVIRQLFRLRSTRALQPNRPPSLPPSLIADPVESADTGSATNPALLKCADLAVLDNPEWVALAKVLATCTPPKLNVTTTYNAGTVEIDVAVVKRLSKVQQTSARPDVGVSVTSIPSRTSLDGAPPRNFQNIIHGMQIRKMKEEGLLESSSSSVQESEKIHHLYPTPACESRMPMSVKFLPAADADRSEVKPSASLVDYASIAVYYS